MSEEVWHHQKTKQAGFSVIELMIATLLGIIIIGGIIGVFLSSSNNYRLQSAISQVQEKGRFALRKMRIDIQKAGYYINPAEDQVAIELTDNGVSLGLAGAEDVLSIYSRHGSPTSIHRTSYFLMRTASSSTTDLTWALYKNAVDDITDPLLVSPVIEQIVTGVARMEYRFAADLTSTAGMVSDQIKRSVDWIPLTDPDVGFSAYLTADQLEALSDFIPATASAPSRAWNSVRAVQVELIVASDENFVVDTPQTIDLPTPFVVAAQVALGSNGDARGLGEDQYYQVYTTTYALRNRVE